MRVSPGCSRPSSRSQTRPLSLPLKVRAGLPLAQRAESTLSFSNSSKAIQGPTGASAMMSIVAAAVKLSSPMPVGLRVVSMVYFSTSAWFTRSALKPAGRTTPWRGTA